MRAALLIASLQAVGALCPERVDFDGVELRKKDEGYYENNVGSIKLAQNLEDRTWMFLNNERLETLVSFDGDECVSDTNNWYKLEFYRTYGAVSTLRYREKLISIKRI